MRHDLASPAPSSPPSVHRQDGRPSLSAFRSPGLAAMTRRYIDGEIGVRQLLAFNGAVLGTSAGARVRRPY